MMYNQKLVASIKANSKILREFKDTVYIPFNSEYSILLKNLNTVRSIVNVFIDGVNVVPGGIVLGAGQEIDLERSIKNNNLTEGNRFKFVERTSKIENGPRGIKLEDGLIRVEYQFEKVYQRQDGIQWNIDKRWVPGHYAYDKYYPSTGVLRGMGLNQTFSSVSGSTSDTMNVSYNSSASLATDKVVQSLNSVTGQSLNDTGITVPGSKSEQKFVTASWFPTEIEKHSIVLKLLGETIDNKPVLKAVTTKHKPECVTCGKKNKANAKFCTECGTALEIFA